jgi:hypothetical protein
MTDLVDQQTDAMEHAHHSAHAAASGDRLTLRVTLSIAVMAVVAAFIGALGETEATHIFVEKDEAVLAQAKASDAWAFYQAESIKKNLYAMGAGLAQNAEAAAKLAAESERFAKEQPSIQADAKRRESEVDAHGASAEAHFGRHHRLIIAEGIVHTAIAGASIALLARRRALWIGSLALTAAGMVVAVSAYAI